MSYRTIVVHAELSNFDSIAASEGVLSYGRRLMDDDPAGGLQARYADLIVGSQCDLEEPVSHVNGGLPEDVVINGGRPVLIIPYAGQFPRVGARVLIPWDGSPIGRHRCSPLNAGLRT